MNHNETLDLDETVFDDELKDEALDRMQESLVWTQFMTRAEPSGTR